jgi:phosphoribosylanthranilate isomerase
MQATVLPRAKICCIASLEEARLAIDAGADVLGLVSAMPSGPGPIPEPLIGRIAAAVPPGVTTFLLTAHQSVTAIVEQQRRLRRRRCKSSTISLTASTQNSAKHYQGPNWSK